jgi:hypothetical protein
MRQVDNHRHVKVQVHKHGVGKDLQEHELSEYQQPPELLAGSVRPRETQSYANVQPAIPVRIPLLLTGAPPGK